MSSNVFFRPNRNREAATFDFNINDERWGLTKICALEGNLMALKRSVRVRLGTSLNRDGEL